jgi:hypothetical protein
MKLCPVALLLLAFSVTGTGQDAPSPAPPRAPAETSATAAKLDLTPDANGNLSQEQMRQLIRVAAQNYRANYKRLRDYTYIERDVERKLDGNGETKSTEIKTYELMEIYGERVNRLIEKDDKPVSAKDAAKEDERIQKLADRRKNESEEERSKREAEKEKRREKGREFVSEVADAYNFHSMGSEIINGREAWVIDGEPRPGFQAHLKEAEMLSKIHGRLWIDKSEMQLAKIDIAAIDTLSFGWILARIHAGTGIVYEWTKINDEVWLPLRYEGKLDVRIALFKRDNEQAEGTYRDYKKFRTSSRIVSVGEVREQK